VFPQSEFRVDADDDFVAVEAWRHSSCRSPPGEISQRPAGSILGGASAPEIAPQSSMGGRTGPGQHGADIEDRIPASAGFGSHASSVASSAIISRPRPAL